MIKTETSGVCVRHYSDAGMKIRQIETNTLWNDAVDVIPCRFTYEETDEPVDDAELDAEETMGILLGGGVIG